MHYLDNPTWQEPDAVDMLESKMPKDFVKVQIQLYRDRLQQVIEKGLQYTDRYFFVRNSLRQYEKQR